MQLTTHLWYVCEMFVRDDFETEVLLQSQFVQRRQGSASRRRRHDIPRVLFQRRSEERLGNLRRRVYCVSGRLSRRGRPVVTASPRRTSRSAFRQPRQSCLDSPPHSPVSSSLLSSPLSSFITPSLFHSRLKTYLFNKSFPP